MGADRPRFCFSDTWQLVINTSTTIVTFLMVFLIQNTQNRESTAVQLKLDELIRAIAGAHNALLDLEELEEEDLERLRSVYEALARLAGLPALPVNLSPSCHDTCARDQEAEYETIPSGDQLAPIRTTHRVYRLADRSPHGRTADGAHA